MKNLLILGSGFIGKSVAKFFEGKVSRIVLLYRNINKHDRFFMNDTNILSVQGTIADLNIIQNIIIHYEIDTILHLVSNLIPSSSNEEFYYEIESVVLPTFKIIDFVAARKVKFIFFSSGGTIYGRQSGMPVEGSPLSPINYYGQSKLLIEEYIRFKHRSDNFKYLIIRPSNIYGNIYDINFNQGLVTIVALKILAGEEVEIWGDGNTVRDFLYIEDFCEALYRLLMLDIDHEEINIGCGKGCSVIQVVNMIEEATRINAKVVFKPKRFEDLDRVVLDIRKIETLIHFKPIDIQEGIQLFIKAFMENFTGDE